MKGDDMALREELVQLFMYWINHYDTNMSADANAADRVEELLSKYIVEKR